MSFEVFVPRCNGAVRFSGDPLVAGSSLASIPSLEKSNFRLTGAAADVALDATIEPRVGEDTGPRDGFLLAGDCKNVLIGDLERGGGNRRLFLSVRTAVGSGIVPERHISFHVLRYASELTR